MQMLAWVAAYLAMDVAYVVASNGTYMRYVSKISGGPPKNKTKVAVSALIAYSLMAVGWAYIVVPAAERLAKRHGKALAGAIAGGLYGLVLYGVFNGTVGAMFDGWTYGVMLRDTLWGTLSVAAFTAAYMANTS
jgi:uncharacterized membrane protein